MEKNGGGAKPKTGPGGTRQDISGPSGIQSDASAGRANQQEATPASSGQGSYCRSYRSNRSNNNSTTGNPSDSKITTNDSISRGGSVPNSVARNRLINNARGHARPSMTEYSPMVKHSGSNASQGQGRSRPPFARPVLLPNNSKSNSKAKNSEPPKKTDKKMPPDVGSSQTNLSVDSESPPVDDPESPPSAFSSSVQEVAVDDARPLHRSQTGMARPVSTSRDAALARQLMQEDMEAMMTADEELARQLQDELNARPGPRLALSNPLQFGGSREESPETSSPEAHSPPLFPLPMPRGRHYHNRPVLPRGEEVRRRRGRGGGGGGMQVMMRLPGAQGAIGIMPRDGGPGMRMLIGGPRRRGQRPPDSPEEEGADLPQGELDPDEQLLAGGHPEDFLSIMHDPSLMLLMLLLRAPETLNEGGVDMEDYEGLWELAERLGEVRRRGISHDEINKLPTHKFRPPKPEVGAVAAEAGSVQCQICLVDFESGDALRCIPCKHDFHKDCIDEWLKRNATCPICRQEIKPS